MTKEFSVNGPPVLLIIGLSLVALKLLGLTTWSWWWVTLPFWGLPALVMAFGVILAIAMICGKQRAYA